MTRSRAPNPFMANQPGGVRPMMARSWTGASGHWPGSVAATIGAMKGLPPKWIPAVSNAALVSNFPSAVVYQGGGSGWLYRQSQQPMMVSVVAQQQGGPTGVQVQIASAPVAAAPNPQGAQQFMNVRTINPAAQDTFTASMPSTGCFDLESSSIVYGDGQGQSVTLINQIDSDQGPLAIVMLGNGQQVTVPICESEPPPPPPPPSAGSCCYDKALSILKCDVDDPRDGQSVKLINSFVQPDGTPIAVVQLLDGSLPFDAVICETPPGMCCYDVAAGTLRCPNNGGLNGQQVSLVAMTQQTDGTILAIVQIQGQSQIVTYPICDDEVSDCCYDANTNKIVCPGNALDGMDAGIVSSWVDNQGTVWVWAAWPGGGARMTLCPGQTKCPPVLCCVNVETNRFVCPGAPNLNGQAVQLADIVTEDGFNWGVLADGSKVPLCGRDCPPPETCPGCPGCPPGLWMSPDGACSLPPPPQDCPQCPPGDRQPCPPYGGGVVYAGDRFTAQIANPQEVTHDRLRHVAARQTLSANQRRAMTSNPKKACCDACAQGKACTGCADARAKNPCGCESCKQKERAVAATNPKKRPRRRMRVFRRKGAR